MKIVNKELLKEYDYQPGTIVYISTSSVQNINDYSFYINAPDSDLAKYYIDKNIDIYNENDPAFTDPCFISEKFEFDLTQKYRKNKVFQKQSYSNPKCIYQKFDPMMYKMEFTCQGVEATDNGNAQLNFNPTEQSIKNADKVYNLPMKCANKIQKNLKLNIALWTFFLIFFLEFIYCLCIVLLSFRCLKNKLIDNALKNDGIANDEEKIDKKKDIADLVDAIRTTNRPINNTSASPQEKKKNDSDNDNKQIESNHNDDLKSCLLRNLKELHPVASLFRVSVISPLIINSLFFAFNTSNIFGFNALMYFENMIEKRIYDNNRNNFAYPLRKEFGKIILSILLQMILITIIRFIALISFDDKKTLSDEIKNGNDAARSIS